MKIYTKIACLLVWCVLFVGSVQAQQKRSAAQEQALRAQYGDNFEEVLDKYQDDPQSLMRFQKVHQDQLFNAPADLSYLNRFDPDDIGRDEVEDNNSFANADNIDDMLTTPGRTAEYDGKLIRGTLSPGDVDVYEFTVDPDRMYYFAGVNSEDNSGDRGGLRVSMRLYHESDLDTTLVVGLNGIEGNDREVGNILGRNTDYRANSGDFRLTGWTAPIDAATGEELTGKFYLWITNRDGNEGTYHFSAYSVPFNPWIDRAEPNADIISALSSQSILPADGVVRTYMNFSPDTIKVVNPPIPVQGNSVYPQLLAQGDEDLDLYLINYKAGHTLTIETMPFFGWQREVDGSFGPGNSRWTDPRIRLYDVDFTTILAEDDDGAREDFEGDPNNIHSRLVLDSNFFAERGITEDGPLWLWVTAWASQTREPGRSVDNSDPGRFMYDLYATLVPEDNAEAEPNGSVAEATQATASGATVISGAFSDAADEDYYRVFMHELRMYTIFTANSTVSSDIEIEIYREEELEYDGATFDMLNVTGNLLTESVAGNAGNNDFIINGYIPEESGAYIIKLTSASAGAYELGLLDKGEIWDGLVANEPDNEAADALSQEAMEVGPGAQAETALIFPAGDIDHYYFSVDDGFELALSLMGTSADLVNDFPATMTLFDAEFNEIDSNASAISQTLAAGTYVVRVEAQEEGAIGYYSLSGGLPFEETEDNNSFADADQIALGQIYNATLTSGDVDYYQFNLKAGNLYSFRSLDNNTGGELSVGFFDTANGETILDETGWPDNYSGSNFKIANIIPREDRTYYLSVSGGAGDYKLISRVNTDYLALQSKGEPNNSAAEADAMGAYQAFGADVMFALADPTDDRFFGDEDWFRVEMAAGQTLTAETKPVGEIVNEDESFWARDTDTRLVIVGADGSELVNDDDGGNDWYSFASYAASSDEVVYVQVRTSRDPEGADDRSLNRGDYLLNMTLTQAEAEPNNTFAEANAAFPGLTQAAFSEEDVVDVYSMTLEADHIYHVRTVRPEDGAYGGAFTAMLFSADDTSTNLLSEENTGYNDRYSGDNVKLNIIPETSGEYLLYLMGDGGAGMYYLGLKGRDISELTGAGEPNNTIAEADAIGDVGFNAPGEVTTYMLYNADFPFAEGDEISTQYSDDLDYYKVELVEGDTLIAETSPVDGPLWPRDSDMFMELYDAEGNLLADNDDGGFDWHSRIEYVATATGPVFVLVRSQDFEGATDRDPARGEYNLSITKQDGSAVIIPTNTEDLETPDSFELAQNYPNPFNPTTTIAYSIPESVEVELAVYNILGQRVATLVSTFQQAGTHQVSFDATNMASGMYLYRIVAGDHVSTKRMMLVK